MNKSLKYQDYTRTSVNRTGFCLFVRHDNLNNNQQVLILVFLDIFSRKRISFYILAKEYFV